MENNIPLVLKWGFVLANNGALYTESGACQMIIFR